MLGTLMPSFYFKDAAVQEEELGKSTNTLALTEYFEIQAKFYWFFGLNLKDQYCHITASMQPADANAKWLV